MRLLMLISVILLVIALVAALVPTTPLGADALTWLIAGLLVWAVDVLLGGYVVAFPAQRGGTPQA